MWPFVAELSELRHYQNAVTFFVGDNGSGKSSNLAKLAREAMQQGQPMLAISNTVYDRFPRVQGSYSQLAGVFRRNLPSRSLTQAIMTNDIQKREQNLQRIGKVLYYMGFDDEIGISIPKELFRRGYHPWQDQSLAAEIFQMFSSQPDGIIWLRSFESGYGRSSLNILSLLQQEIRTKRQMHFPLRFHLQKDGIPLEIDQASSGELTLLAMYAFIAANIKEGALLLIDEPENSLHPKWQHEYCLRLMDMFYLYSPQVIVATHSPVIVSGAQGGNLPIKILEVEGELLRPRQATSSIEATLYESFHTLPPSNHFLSEQIAALLDALSHRALTEMDFEKKIQSFEQQSYDQKQKKFLSDVRELGKAIINDLSRGAK